MRVVRTVKPLCERMEKRGFPVSPLLLWPAAVIYQWAEGGDWDRIIAKTGISEGDMAMLVLRTADNLRQLVSLKETHPEMSSLAAAAREAILREPVVF
jgi:ATP-dependent RNA helicase HelY